MAEKKTYCIKTETLARMAKALGHPALHALWPSDASAKVRFQGSGVGLVDTGLCRVIGVGSVVCHGILSYQWLALFRHGHPLHHPFWIYVQPYFMIENENPYIMHGQ